MALVRIPERQQTIDDKQAISSFLATYGITYERWESSRSVPADATAEAVLQVYSDKIEELKARGGYTTADVIDVAHTPGSISAATGASAQSGSFRMRRVGHRAIPTAASTPSSSPSASVLPSSTERCRGHRFEGA